MLRGTGRVGVVAMLVVMLAGCSVPDADGPPQDDATKVVDSEEGDPGVAAAEEDDSGLGVAQEDKVFVGTPAEYSAAMMACLEEAGAAVELVPGSNVRSSFEIGDGDPELIREVMESCRDEVGHSTEHPDPDGRLEAVYEHHLWQRDCLLDLGYDMPAPPTFEQYSETRDYDVFGADGAGLRGEETHFALQECPNYDDWLYQQEQGAQP
jgi:hypothetical protein